MALLLLAFSTPALMKKGFPQSQTAASAPPKFALIEFFNKFDHLETLSPPDLLAKVLPGVNSVDVARQTDATGKTVRTEALTLLEQAP